MTIARDIAETSYTARQVVETVVVPEKAVDFRASFTRKDWPEGEVAFVEILDPVGVVVLRCGFSGGAGPTRRPESVVGVRNPGGLLPGSYTVRIDVKKPIRTAIKLEHAETRLPLDTTVRVR